MRCIVIITMILFSGLININKWTLKNRVTNKQQPKQEIPTDKQEYTIIFFNADWCAPCQELKRTIQNKEIQDIIKKDYDFYSINIDKSSKFVQAYKITSIPVLVIGKNLPQHTMKEIRRSTGSLNIPDLKKFLALPTSRNNSVPSTRINTGD